MGKIIAYCREGCPHSNNASKTLNALKDKYDIEIKFIKDDDKIKNGLKEKLKEIIGDHSTFPIILYETSKKKLLLVGGNDKLQEIIKYIDSVHSKEDILKLDLTKTQKRVLYYLFKK